MKFTLLLPALILLSSCALSRRPMNTPVPVASTPEAPVPTMDAVDVEWSALEKVEESAPDNHALVETPESEAQIAEAVGGDPDAAQVVEDDRAPMPFLKKVRTKRVQFWIDYFTKKERARFQRFLNNGALYRPIIEKIMDEEGVPRELFFVGLIESGYYLGAHSHASAVGPWQFIRGTGRRYGLASSRELDERRDIFKATQAAALYFKDLHSIFHSWELALAAYNAGEYGMVRRIRRYGTRDYYELSRRRLLPEETINYVPKVLAAMHVVQNAEKYGFTFPTAAGMFWQKTKQVRVPRGTSLSTLASRLKVSPALLGKLNPELRGPRTPRYAGRSYLLRVPADRHTEWMDTLVADAPEALPREKEIESLNARVMNPAAFPMPAAPVRVHASARPETHRVRRGETLTSIARKHGTNVRTLASANRISVRTRVRIGQVLRLTPVRRDEVRTAHASTRRTVASAKPTSTATPLMLRVKKGDTLTSLSRLFNVSVDELKRANKIAKGRRLLAGKRLCIPGSRRGSYTVRRGDGLYQVARKFGLNHEALMRLNDLKGNQLMAGQRLVVNLE